MVELKRSEFIEITALGEVPAAYFDGNQSIERIRFISLDFDGWKFNHSRLKTCEFEECTFHGCIFDRMDLQRVSFRDCKFNDCILSPDFRYITGEVLGTTMVNCDFSGAHIQNVKWLRSSLQDCTLDYLKGKSIAFHETPLKNVTFHRANIVRGDFRTTPDLRRDLFYTAKLDDCVFAWNEVFVVMQYGTPELDNLYDYGILPVIRDELGIECRRVDRYEFKGRITDEILQNIITARIVVAECSAANKNVYFEVGYALGRAKEVVFLVDEASNIPFDLHDYPFLIHHRSIDSLKDLLRKRMKFLLDMG